MAKLSPVTARRLAIFGFNPETVSYNDALTIDRNISFYACERHHISNMHLGILSAMAIKYGIALNVTALTNLRNSKIGGNKSPNEKPNSQKVKAVSDQYLKTVIKPVQPKTKITPRYLAENKKYKTKEPTKGAVICSCIHCEIEAYNQNDLIRFFGITGDHRRKEICLDCE